MKPTLADTGERQPKEEEPREKYQRRSQETPPANNKNNMTSESDLPPNAFAPALAEPTVIVTQQSQPSSPAIALSTSD